MATGNAVAYIQVTPGEEIKMQKNRLLQAVCAVAMLAAMPAFGQSNTPPAGAEPADTGNMAAPAAGESHTTHHSARAHRTGAMHSGKTDASQNADVDRLNEQSYQAAQKGEAFGGGGPDQGSSGMTRPNGSGNMNTMPGGPMPGGPMPGSDATGQGSRP
jgi:hypothetical protein